ncbi:MAG: hypothetical protein C4525_15030 [Desulfarculus sp.]|nr:MAG: hypothetical protein C4525_15030 [Desulfarculus sp.]
MIKYQLRIGGRTKEVALDPEAGRAMVGGEQHDLTWQQIGPGRLLLSLDGRQVRAFLAPADSGRQVFIEGRTYLVQDEQKLPRRRRGAAGQGPGAVTPPTPAMVVRILVQEGQAVDQGQGLVVVSAMKMETTLCAPYAGTVSKINTRLEAKVAPGEVLVEIAEEGQ